MEQARIESGKLDIGDVIFYLGTHHEGWLGHAGVPLFVSRRRLARRKKLPRALARWALDSGGFSELQMYGRWTVSPEQYVAEVRRFRDDIGLLDWAAPQDLMCEPFVIRGLVRRRRGKKKCQIASRSWLKWADGRPALAEAVREARRLGDDAEVVFHGTGLSVEEHQRLTIENFLTLRRLAPDLPFIPVLQGWSLTDYWRHVDAYRGAGVALQDFDVVGVGSVCRRQSTAEVATIFESLVASGIRPHGFGVKKGGIARYLRFLVSADSLAWSTHYRHRSPLPGHDTPGPGRRTGHINCANCLEAAMRWRAEVCQSIETERQCIGGGSSRSSSQFQRRISRSSDSAQCLLFQE